MRANNSAEVQKLFTDCDAAVKALEAEIAGKKQEIAAIG